MLIRGSGAQTKATASRVLLILDGNVLAGQFPESRADAVRDCGRPRLDVCEYLIRDPIPYGFEADALFSIVLALCPPCPDLLRACATPLSRLKFPRRVKSVHDFPCGRAARRSER